MSADWKLTRLGDETELLCGFPFSSKQYTDQPSDIRLLRGDNIGQGYVRWTNAKRWPIDDAPNFKQYELRENDVVLAMDRPWIEAGLKYSAIRSDDVPSLLLQRTARLRGGPDLENAFLRYVIGSPEFTRHIQSITTGSLVPHISARQIQEFTFRKPPLATQQRIAAVLSALDAKIELNQRLNAELEGLAKLLYDYWFVQYDFPLSPAQAAALRKPHLTGHPYRSSGGPMVYHDQLKREIPMGWEVEDLQMILSLAYGKALRKEDQLSGPYPVYGSGGIYGMHHEALVKGPGVIVGRKGTVGSLHWEDRDFFPTDTTYYVIPESGYSLVYLMHLLQSLNLPSMNTDSAVPGLSHNNAYSRKIALPPPEVISSFTEIVVPMRCMMTANQQQSHHLAQLRDWLLPMLMNGQVQVEWSI